MAFLIRTEKVENIALVSDIEELHRQTKDWIDDMLRDVDEKGEKLPYSRALLINDLVEHQTKLRDFAEMLKVPFDVLVVVQKEE